MNDEYQTRVFFEPEEGWMDKIIRQLNDKLVKEAERLFYTADEGSVLDRIWKGTYNTDKLKNKKHE